MPGFIIRMPQSGVKSALALALCTV